MMKRVIVLILCVVFLAGCSTEQPESKGQSLKVQYPRVEYRNSTYNFDPYNREITVKDGYVLDEGHSYDIVETDDGYDVVLHFVEIEKDGDGNG